MRRKLINTLELTGSKKKKQCMLKTKKVTERKQKTKRLYKDIILILVQGFEK